MTTTKKLNKIHARFAAWRQHHRRGPYPTKLHQEAIASLDLSQLQLLGDRLGLPHAQILRWKRPPGRPLTSPSVHTAPAEFIEVANPWPLPLDDTSRSNESVQVEVVLPSGARLSLRGGVDAGTLAALVTALQSGKAVPA
jgi:hypothetical protein